MQNWKTDVKINSVLQIVLVLKVVMAKPIAMNVKQIDLALGL